MRDKCLSHVSRITFLLMQVHTLFAGIANTHLIENSRGVIIIDAGMPHQASRILIKIRNLGHAPQDVRAILLTHGHIDHAGSALRSACHSSQTRQACGRRLTRLVGVHHRLGTHDCV